MKEDTYQFSQFKTILLATFINVTNIKPFLVYLEEKFKIKPESVFVHTINGSETNYLLTYKVKLEVGKKLDIKKLLNNTVIIHKKGSTIFTINALNKLIETESGLSKGNIDFSTYQIKWEEYKDKMIMLRGKNLEVSDLKRVFLSE
jgi:hypothetical protein